MKLKPNIDNRGRRARIVTGIVVDLGGIALIVTGVYADSSLLWGMGILACVAGSFTIFEGARAWCLLRAMGMKTRL